MVHEVAAAGFEDSVDYEAARPSYPPEAVAWFVAKLDLAPGKRVVDLAAGTGKFTRLLQPSGVDLIAVEPVPGMRATFRTVVADVPLVAGTSEAMPFADSSLDAVTVAQAWHWFDHERSAAEMQRVLKPGGALGLVWNARDRSEPWVNEVWAIMDRVEKRAPWRDHDNWKDSASREMPHFGTMETAEFRHVQPITREGVVQRIVSVSHVAVLPPAEHEAVLDEVRAVLDHHPDVRGRTELGIPYRVDCLAVRQGSPTRS